MANPSNRQEEREKDRMGQYAQKQKTDTGHCLRSRPQQKQKQEEEGGGEESKEEDENTYRIITRETLRIERRSNKEGKITRKGESSSKHSNNQKSAGGNRRSSNAIGDEDKKSRTRRTRRRPNGEARSATKDR